MGMQLTGSLSISGSIVTTGVVNAGSITATGTQYVSDTTTPTNFDSTAAIYTDGGMRVTKNVYLSSSLYLKGDLTVYGTQSINYITSSQLDISDNIINVNTATPGVRFGGIAVYDSGSTGLTGSFLWDSQNNKWVYSNPSGSGYDGGMAIFGPRNTSGLGSEQGTTSNALMKGQGGDHITSSLITEDGALMSVYSTMYVSSSGNVGIGNINPLTKFVVATTSNVNFEVRNGADYGVTGVAIDSRDDTRSARNAMLVYGSPIILGGGNVGIGNTSPQGALHIGSALTNSGDAAAIILKQTSTTAATGIYLERSGEQKGYYMYVGGSTDSLTFQRNNAGTKSDVLWLTREGHLHTTGRLAFNSPVEIMMNCNYDNGTDIVTETGYTARIEFLKSDGILRFQTGTTGASYTAGAGANNSDRMVILPDGKVGIGTSSPTTILQVRKNFWQFWIEKAHGSNANLFSITIPDFGGVVVTIAGSRYSPGSDNYSGTSIFYIATSNVGVINITSSSTSGTYIPSTSTSGRVVTFYSPYAGSSTNYSGVSVTIVGSGHSGGSESAISVATL